MLLKILQIKSFPSTSSNNQSSETRITIQLTSQSEARVEEDKISCFMKEKLKYTILTDNLSSRRLTTKN